MKLKLALLVGLFAFGYALSASAGAVVDSDADLVPDQFDNCKNLANGPNQPSNQVDTDIDGWGNACDQDMTNVAGSVAPFQVLGDDFALFAGFFGQSSAAAKEADYTGDGQVLGDDFAIFAAHFGINLLPSVSGLACAGTIPCTP